MKIKSAKLRKWNTQYEFSVKINISDCSTYPLTTKELFSVLDNQDKEEYLKIGLGYTQTWGNERLRQTIAETYQKIKADNILITNGAIEGIFLILNSLSNPGDEMISLFPIYQSLYQIPQTCGVKIKWWNLDENDNFSPDFDQLIKLISPRTKAIIINQPHVPTGFIFDKNEYQDLISIARKYNLYLISDEVCRWLYLKKENEIPPVVNLYEKAISIGDFSKPFGTGGLRIGWLVCQNRKIIEKCISLRGYTTMSNSAPSEYLATLVLKNKDKFLKPRVETALTNYQLLEQFVQRNKRKISLIKPRGSVTAFPKIKLGIDSREFCKGLIEKENTLLVPGDVYGINNRFRIGFGCTTDNFERGLEKLQLYLNNFDL